MDNALFKTAANASNQLEPSAVIVHPEDPSRNIVGLFSKLLYATFIARSYSDLLVLLKLHKPIFLFIDCPWQGHDLLSIVRSANTIDDKLFIIARAETDDELDRILAIEMGADDCVAASCSHNEIKAKFRAFNRRRHLTANDGSKNTASVSSSSSSGEDEQWYIDKAKYQVCSSSGARVKLTSTEYTILSALFDRPGEICERASILALTKTDEEAQNDRNLDVYIMRMRKKLAKYGGSKLIETVKGKGYRLGGVGYINR